MITTHSPFCSHISPLWLALAKVQGAGQSCLPAIRRNPGHVYSHITNLDSCVSQGTHRWCLYNQWRKSSSSREQAQAETKFGVSDGSSWVRTLMDNRGSRRNPASLLRWLWPPTPQLFLNSCTNWPFCWAFMVQPTRFSCSWLLKQLKSTLFQSYRGMSIIQAWDNGGVHNYGH